MELSQRKFRLGDIIKVTIIESDVEYEVVDFIPDTAALFNQAMTGAIELDRREFVQCRPLLTNGLTVELHEDEIELVRRKDD
jgi:hypothetical protein